MTEKKALRTKLFSRIVNMLENPNTEGIFSRKREKMERKKMTKGRRIGWNIGGERKDPHITGTAE